MLTVNVERDGVDPRRQSWNGDDAQKSPTVVIGRRQVAARRSDRRHRQLTESSTGTCRPRDCTGAAVTGRRSARRRVGVVDRRDDRLLKDGRCCQVATAFDDQLDLRRRTAASSRADDRAWVVLDKVRYSKTRRQRVRGGCMREPVDGRRRRRRRRRKRVHRRIVAG